MYVQNYPFTPGSGSAISSIGLTEEYGYTLAGQVNIKRLQINEQLPGGGAPLTLCNLTRI